MQTRDRIVPVVGNVAGDKAVKAIGAICRPNSDWTSRRSISRTSSSISWARDGGFDAYAQNVKTLPRDSTSVIIRSYFGRFGTTHPLYVPAPGNISTSMIEPIDSFVARVRRRRAHELHRSGVRPLRQAVMHAAPPWRRCAFSRSATRTRSAKAWPARALAGATRGDASRSRHAGRRPNDRRAHRLDDRRAVRRHRRRAPAGPVRSRHTADRREQPVPRAVATNIASNSTRCSRARSRLPRNALPASSWCRSRIGVSRHCADRGEIGRDRARDRAFNAVEPRGGRAGWRADSSTSRRSRGGAAAEPELDGGRWAAPVCRACTNAGLAHSSGGDRSHGRTGAADSGRGACSIRCTLSILQHPSRRIPYAPIPPSVHARRGCASAGTSQRKHHAKTGGDLFRPNREQSSRNDRVLRWQRSSRRRPRSGSPSKKVSTPIWTFPWRSRTRRRTRSAIRTSSSREHWPASRCRSWSTADRE